MKVIIPFSVYYNPLPKSRVSFWSQTTFSGFDQTHCKLCHTYDNCCHLNTRNITILYVTHTTIAAMEVADPLQFASHLQQLLLLKYLTHCNLHHTYSNCCYWSTWPIAICITPTTIAAIEVPDPLQFTSHLWQLLLLKYQTHCNLHHTYNNFCHWSSWPIAICITPTTIAAFQFKPCQAIQHTFHDPKYKTGHFKKYNKYIVSICIE